MADAITVAVRRGDVVESRHRVHAVAVRDGAVVAEAGDGGLVTFMRSAAKPIQALPLVRAAPDLDGREIAIACASHLARPEQLEAVRSLLARAPAGEDELACGPAGEPPARSKHNCSGKHAGMLALCRVNGWDSRGYHRPDHPCQRAMLGEVARAAEVSEEEIPTGVDGCGVVTFALPLERMAHAFSRLPDLEGGTRVVDAMRANPELIRGPGAPDTEVMLRYGGWTAKGGAEGLFCAADPDGLGIALKVEDGNGRALPAALGTFFTALRLPDELERVTVENSRGEAVGDLRAE